ncbi:MEDS domain-containing protein [Streptomyces polygonati]|uniref:MEDS domain-containing protein n=1 Tax=Streptomyces polygonati TaxID=1617087 RepID=A0ABV8HVY0_9ACTN
MAGETCDEEAPPGTSGARAPRMVAVERLGPGDHACLWFDSHEDRWALRAAFATDGLARGERVIFFTDPDTVEDEALDRLASFGVPVDAADGGGRVEVVGTVPGYEPGRGFDAAARNAHWVTVIRETWARGFTGLRATGDMSWAARPDVDGGQLAAYEAGLTPLLAKLGFTGVCEYDRGAFGGSSHGADSPAGKAGSALDLTRPWTVPVADPFVDEPGGGVGWRSAHSHEARTPNALDAPVGDKPGSTAGRLDGRLEQVLAAHPLNVMPVPGGLHSSRDGNVLRLAGDADLATRIPFEQAVREAGLTTIDLTGLAFVDAYCVRTLLRLGGVTLECTTAQYRLLELCGAAGGDQSIVEVRTRPAGRSARRSRDTPR